MSVLINVSNCSIQLSLENRCIYAFRTDSGYHKFRQLTGHEAYNHSHLTVVPQLGYVGLVRERVLPISTLRDPVNAPANNLFILIPQNLCTIMKRSPC